jgi:hypothetical protein
MKRPPKTKNSAALARATTGAASAESPDFYRINEIAPLPVPNHSFAATPPTGDGVADDQRDPFMDTGQMKLITWDTPEPKEKDPFEDSSPETVDEIIASNAATSNETVITHIPGRSANESQESARLSEIDLSYLANQNRLLVLYAKDDQTM